MTIEEQITSASPRAQMVRSGNSWILTVNYIRWTPETQAIDQKLLETLATGMTTEEALSFTVSPIDASQTQLQTVILEHPNTFMILQIHKNTEEEIIHLSQFPLLRHFTHKVSGYL